jgi:hypothetical protein
MSAINCSVGYRPDDARRRPVAALLEVLFPGDDRLR